MRVFDLPTRKLQLQELETQSEDPTLWDDPNRAQDVMRQLAAARSFVSPFESIEKRSADLLELIEMARMEGDSGMAEEIESELPALEADYHEFEKTLLFAD